MRKLHPLLAGAVLAAVLALGPTASAASAHGGHDSATTVRVTGGEFWFKLSTKTLAKPGPVTFVFKNVGHVSHDFKILGRSTPVISPGRSSSITVQFTKPGSYPYSCSVPGHAAAGMKGQFTVR